MRLRGVKDWRRLPLIGWSRCHAARDPGRCRTDAVPNVVILLIYSDSFLFVFGAAIVQYSFDSKNDPVVCQSATLMCLSGYLTSKVSSRRKLKGGTRC